MNRSVKISRLGTGLIILSVLALLVTPVVMERQARALRDCIAQLGEPARERTSQVQLALALEAASVRGYVINGSTAMIEDYRGAREAEQKAFRELFATAAQLGDGVEMAARWASKASESWNARSEKLVAGELAREEFVAALGDQQQLYRAALHASGHLAQSISDYERDKRTAIQRQEHRGSLLLVGLTALASVAAAITVYMNRSVRMLSSVATTDLLTGLLNRRGFLEAASRLLRDHESLPVTLMYVDVDEFKTINDAHGHAAGDEVLKRLGQAIKGCVRPADLAARLGRDEFVLLLRNQDDPAQSGGVVERIASRLRTTLQDEAQRVTVSIGAVTAAAEQRLPELLHAADSTMFEVKRQGKNTMLWRELPDVDPSGEPSPPS